MNPDESKGGKIRMAPFVLAALCFLLPFVEISCQNQKIPISGIKLAFGGSLTIKDPDSSQTQTMPVQSQVMLLLALLCAASGAGACFMAGKNGKLVPAVAGGLGVLFLIIGRSNLQSGGPPQAQGVMEINTKFGFILALLLLLAAAGLSFWQFKQEVGTMTASPPPPPPPPTPPPPPGG